MFQLATCPSAWPADQESAVSKKLKFEKRYLETAGKAYAARLRRIRLGRTLEEDYLMYLALKDAALNESSNLEEEKEDPELLKSDPANWKELDHYAVMGLSKLRFRATEDDIKNAYRRKVLKHHPDKKAAEGYSDSFFKCIQKSWDVLSDPRKRRQWDSVDPIIKDTIPKASDSRDFFELYHAVFSREARFAKHATVPHIGNIDTPREEVDNFYQFWFSFDSWRSFEYHDEEDADNAEGRDEKRWIEKKNKAQRQKMKKDDNARILRLVDQAFGLDPRIKLFKKMEKEKKQQKKQEREMHSKAAEIEAKKAEEEERQKQAAQLELEKAKQQEEKKEKEAAKNAVRKEKKSIRRIFRDNNYFLATEDPSAIIFQTEKMDYILDKYDIGKLELVRLGIEAALVKGIEQASVVFDEEYMNAQEFLASNGSTAQAKADSVQISKTAAWEPAETAALIKAVNLYPGGSLSRWEKIAEYVADHGHGQQRSPKECIVQSKSVISVGAADRFAMQQTKSSESKAAEAVKEAEPVSKSDWTAEQQQKLEAGLKKFPAAEFKANPQKRWENVAQMVPGKDKKAVKERVKALQELLAKKNSPK
jgi:DnaJ family protein C protein 2